MTDVKWSRASEEEEEERVSINCHHVSPLALCFKLFSHTGSGGTRRLEFRSKRLHNIARDYLVAGETSRL